MLIGIFHNDNNNYVVLNVYRKYILFSRTFCIYENLCYIEMNIEIIYLKKMWIHSSYEIFSI